MSELLRRIDERTKLAGTNKLEILMFTLGVDSHSGRREILSISPSEIQQVSGKATMVVRGEVLPVLPLAHLVGWEQTEMPEVGVLM
jgi:chemotaxis signal transduction protein